AEIPLPTDSVPSRRPHRDQLWQSRPAGQCKPPPTREPAQADEHPNRSARRRRGHRKGNPAGDQDPGRRHALHQQPGHPPPAGGLRRRPLVHGEATPGADATPRRRPGLEHPPRAAARMDSGVFQPGAGSRLACRAHARRLFSLAVAVQL
ncbi:hypothetical protein E4U41_003211, partial [Claviceps citrina]